MNRKREDAVIVFTKIPKKNQVIALAERLVQVGIDSGLSTDEINAAMIIADKLNSLPVVRTTGKVVSAR